MVLSFKKKRMSSFFYLIFFSFSKAPWEDDDEITNDTGSINTNGQQNELSDTQKHQLRHRELFLTRQNETLLATNIRGKCLVTLHNETETFVSYLNSEV
jgi:hypothetical protein